MLEVIDRLLSSFGVDAKHALNRILGNPDTANSFTIGLSLFVYLIYVILHSLLLFFHFTTITVVVHSGDDSLIALLIAK